MPCRKSQRDPADADPADLRAALEAIANEMMVDLDVTDRIELGTYMLAPAICGGEVECVGGRMDLVAAFDLTDNLATYVKVDNLFDETYASSIRPAGFRPGLPRTAYVGLKFRL